MTPGAFINDLAALRFPGAFNPYAESCPEFDVADAPRVRRENLRLVLEAAISKGVDSIWIARDLGYRGGRRTGLALTDEAHLSAHAGLYGSLPLARATRGPIVTERTAKVVWQILSSVGRPVFLWNVFPLHPHGAAGPLSNRCHNRFEREASSHFLEWLIAELRPKTLVAIGRDAQAALTDLGIKAERVRHPSYGGQGEFLAYMSELYGLRTRAVDQAQPTMI
ncbi:uracil-DNA glycosylase [Methylorubrum extorquens]|uniref:Uracil-DNA glycosylase superfamily n=1 Tax=Methylorubrum extorquens DSM 13060 TaxID=882800 RepID=H1KMC0_METEX|nr:uracil-DNA glycosylase [Methylorubrum extorquens]EHP91332.1 uracil-DNA glycosylase superfamily [Methylorubrum extorquens DSM 13060]